MSATVQTKEIKTYHSSTSSSVGIEIETVNGNFDWARIIVDGQTIIIKDLLVLFHLTRSLEELKQYNIIPIK